MAVLKLHTNPYAMTEDDKRVLAAYIHETMERFEQLSVRNRLCRRSRYS